MPARSVIVAITAVLAACLPASSQAALVLQQDTGTVYETTGFDSSDTTSAGMTGMQVLVEFNNSTTSMATWTPTGASGSGWSLTQGPGSTFNNSWTFRNTGLATISRFTINGRLGNTVFDRQPGSDTAGSQTGTEFSETTALGLVSLLQNVTVTYRDAVVLTGGPIVGDVWSELDVDFGTGLAVLGSFSFIQDTDNVAPGDLTVRAVPEPASMSLMCIAALIVFLARYRKRRRSTGPQKERV